MSSIAVVYWSGTGNTQAMAQLVAEGAKDAGAQVDILNTDEFNADKVAKYSGIALGCPSMGTEQLEESAFEPMYEEIKPALGSKAVALFGSYGWGDGEWMRNWAEDCEATGANMIGEPVICCGAPEGEAEDACKALGAALAKA